jgi:hypothetical protein
LLDDVGPDPPVREVVDVAAADAHGVHADAHSAGALRVL